MIKKALFTTAAAAAVGAFLFGTSFFSYARTTADSVREAVKREVPLEFEIKRARQLVGNLVHDMHDCMHKIAEQQVDIEHLNREIARRSTELAKQKEIILAMRNDLGSGRSTFEYVGLTYSSDEVQRDLGQRFERFKGAEALLERDRQILHAHEKTLKANQRKLDEMIAAKQKLEVEIAQLEARAKTIQAAKAASSLEFDDTQLAQAKTLIRELNKRLDVEQTMLDADGKFPGLIPVETREKMESNVAEQIDAYFDNGKGEGHSVTETVAGKPAA